MENIIHLTEILLKILGAVCILATLIARLTPTTRDDDIMEKMDSFFFKAIAFLPTIGVNPQTTKIKEALVEATVELAEVKATPVAAAAAAAPSAIVSSLTAKPVTPPQPGIAPASVTAKKI